MRKRYRSTGFDPASKIRAGIEARLQRSRGFATGSPKPDWRPTGLLLAAGVLLLVAAFVLHRDARWAVFAPLLVTLLPWLLLGLPVRKGALLVASAMLHNPTDVDYEEAITRLVLNYVPASRPWPFWEGAPFQLDVGFPVGDKSFTLPPGVSTRSYEASPAIAGKIAAIGGHVHEMATRIELIDVAENKVIWSAVEQRDIRQLHGQLGRLG